MRHLLPAGPLLALIIIASALISPFIPVDTPAALAQGQVEPEAPSEPIELTAQRTMHSKTYSLGGRSYAIDSYVTPIHYQAERGRGDWLDIDTTIVDGRVTAAPYLLEVYSDPPGLTVQSRGGGQVDIQFIGAAAALTPALPPSKPQVVVTSNTATWQDIYPGVDLIVIAEHTRVSLRTVVRDSRLAGTLGSDEIKLSYAYYEEPGALALNTRAWDEERAIEVSREIADGVLTETIDLSGAVYPVRIDPTIDDEIAADTDDAGEAKLDGTGWTTSSNSVHIGAWSNYNWVSGLRFADVNIPAGAVIGANSYISVNSASNYSNTGVKVKITAQDAAAGATFSDWADFDGRTWIPDAGYSTWNPTEEWTQYQYYDSASLVDTIQAVVDSVGDVTHLVLRLDDNSSDANNDRAFYCHDYSSNNDTALHIEYTEAAGGACSVVPTAETNAATLVEETTATLNGNVTSLGGANCTLDLRGFVWDASSHGDPGNATAPGDSAYASSWTEASGNVTGTYSHGITSLTKGDVYYFRSCGNNSAGWDYGDELFFLTKPDEPTALTHTGQGNATIGLSWVNGTGANDTIIRYRLDTWPTDYADGTSAYNGNGTTTTVSGLPSGQAVYLNSWSHAGEAGLDSYSDGNSSHLWYTSPGNPYNLTASNIDHDSADLEWTKGQGGNHTRVMYKKGSCPTGYNDGTQAAHTTGNTTSLSGLDVGSTYCVRIWEYDDESGLWSESYDEVQLSTSATSLPTVVTLATTGISTSGASLHGNITSTGTGNCTYRGFVWDSGSHGDPGNTTPAASGYASNWTESGSYGTGNYTHAISGLDPNQEYRVRAAARNAYGWDYGLEESFTTDVAPPAVNNYGGATLVTDTTARLWGNVTYPGGQDVHCTLYWGDNDGGTTPGLWDHAEDAGNQTASFFKDVAALPPSTQHWYRTYGNNTAGEDWADSSATFTTNAATVLPTLDTGNATAIDHDSATLHGNVTATGGENLGLRGFVWDTSSHGEPGNATAPGASAYSWDWTQAGSFGTGTFIRTVTLSANTTYYFRSCGNNSAGWDYGPELFFTTDVAPAPTPTPTPPGLLPLPPTNVVITEIGVDSINISWVTGVRANSTMVRAKRGSYPTSPTDGELICFGPLTSANDTGLALDTTDYRYSLWGHNALGYSATYAKATVGGAAMMMIAEVLLLLGLLGLAFWRHSLVMTLAAIIMAVFLLPHWQETAGWNVLPVVVIIAVGLIGKMITYGLAGKLRL